MINLHILGVQKAGTTALANFLHQHPNIYVVDGKEAHVFDHPNFYMQQDKQSFANNKYKSRLKHYKNQKFICDATPITLYHPQFITDCYRYNPNAKFIVMLRDPAERAISHYHMSCGNKEENRSMLMAFILEKFRLGRVSKQRCWSFESSFRTQSYLQRGLYSKQLQQLYATVPREQVLVMMQSDLKHEHHQTMHRVFEFLDIPKAKAEINPQQIFKTEKKNTHLTDTLAKIYARCYYKWHGESAQKWHNIIHATK